MKKIRSWLYNRFLPEWCRDNLMDTNAHLLGVVSELKRENERLNAYIDGMHTALRRGGKVTIQNGVSK